MTYFPTVIALDLTSITWCPIRTTLVFLLLRRFTGMSWVNSDDRGRAFSTFSVLLTLFLLFFFPSFVGKLVLIGVLGGTWHWFCISNLRFFRLGVFYIAILALGDGEVGWLAALGAVLIHLFSAKAISESRLGLGVDSLFDHLIRAFQLEVLMF